MRQQMARLGREPFTYRALFAGCFRRRAGFALLGVRVPRLLPHVQRHNIETIALEFDEPPRTLQRFRASIKWDQNRVGDTCRQLMTALAREPA